MTFEKYPKILYRYKRDGKKSSFLFNSILFIISFFLVIVFLNIYNPSLVPGQFRLISLSGRQNILLLGCDEIFPETIDKYGRQIWKGRSDTIAILNCNPSKNTLNILNIPRDTRARIPGYGAEKINFLSSIGGPLATKTYLENVLRIKIDHYVVVNIQGLNRIIDEIGGVTIDVPQRMQYVDKSAMLYINLFPGKQVLNGKQAVGFVRFRHDNLGDIGRIQRQQVFMRAVFKKLLDPITFTKLPEIVSIYKQTVLTDLDPREIIKIANFIRNVPKSNQNIVILPGDFGQRNMVSFWIPNQEEINQVVKKIFYDQNSFSFFKKSGIKSVKVSIFNGSRKDKSLSKKIFKLLNKYGYTVLICQDYQTYTEKTKIYAQKANLDVALQVKQNIGNVGEILTGNLGPPDSDVTILAGDDLVNLKAR